MSVLTVTAGAVDAVTFVGLGHVFAALATGNVLLLGFGVAGSGTPIARPAVSLASFVAGVVLAHAFIAKVRGGGHRWFVVTLAVEVLLLFTAGALASVHTLNVHIVIAVIAGAMGWRSRAVVEANIPDMPTTVLQITLVKTIADVLTLRATTPHAPVLTRTRRLATVLGMFTGAVIGALLLRLGLAPALLCIAGFEACLVGLYSRAPLLWPTPQPAG
jgi:uncharacterized membrane protein YoaK (UPF0700 family)